MGTLATFSGQDRPGITSAILSALDLEGVQLLDVDQAVVQGLLSLFVIFDAPQQSFTQLKSTLQTKARELELELKLDPDPRLENTEDKSTSAHTASYITTMICESGITPGSLSRLTKVLASHNLNIREIKRMANSSHSTRALSCLELSLQSTQPLKDPDKLKSEILALAQAEAIDIAFQEDSAWRRAKRLVVMDMDSTLIQNEVIDEMASVHGVGKEVVEITERAMRGEIDFESSLRERVALLKGFPVAAIEDIRDKIQLTPGARTMVQAFKALGCRLGLVTGGFDFFADWLAQKLEFDECHCNHLKSAQGKLTGELQGPIVDARRKSDLLKAMARQMRIPLSQVIAIGDGANDLEMLQAAGLGVAFNAKPRVRERAHVALSSRDLTHVLFLVGLTSVERDLITGTQTEP